MLIGKSVFLSATLLLMMTGSADSATLPASFASPGTVPLTVPAYSAEGHEVDLNLDFAPQSGCNLTVINVTGLDFIEGRFSNLTQGQMVALQHDGLVYKFAANYYGGSGNDLVLHWAAQELAVWGGNSSGQLGTGDTKTAAAPVGIAPPISVLVGRNVTAIASGEDHRLALCSDGTLAAWGNNSYGQLGNGTNAASEIPLPVDRTGVLAGKTVVSIASGSTHNLVLCSDGTLVTWGSNFDGELGKLGQSSSVPVLVDQSGVLAGKTVVKIAAGGTHCLVLCSDGTLAAWGSGPLGNGPTPYSEQSSDVPVLVDQAGVLAGKNVVAISSGGSTSMAVCSDGTLASWGSNSYGQLGNGVSGLGLVSHVPVVVNQDGVLTGKQVVAAAAGRFHALALYSDGTLAAWGYNSHGPLGTGSNASSSVPVAVDQTGFLAGRQVVSLGAGVYSSLVICADGSLAEWGDGFKTPMSAERGILQGKLVASVTSGGGGHLALCSDGTLATWQGGGGLPAGIEPKPSVLHGKTVVSLAGGYHSLALCADGTLAAWGDGDDGQLGNGANYGLQGKSYRIDQNGVLAGRAVVAVAAGSNHSLALCSDGTIAAWGDNSYGQLGDGSVTDRNLPVAVNQSGALAGKKIVALEAGSSFSLALCSDGTVFAWGQNAEGQLGDGTFINRNTPVAVDRSGVLAGKLVVRIASKYTHSIALCADGSLVTWGAGYSGQLGNGSSVDSNVPVLVDQSTVLAGKTIVSIKAFGRGSLVLCADGTLAVWGRNAEGQFGNGTTTSSNLPVLVDQTGVLADKTVVELAAGGDHSVAICPDGTLVAWGYNTSGQLGIGNRLDPVPGRVPVAVDRSGILAGKVVTSLGVGIIHNLAIAAISPLPLRNIATSAGQIAFDPTVTSYALSVAHEVETITFTPTYTSPASGVTVQGLPVASDLASSPIPLAVGANPVAVQVTWSNGLVTTYMIHVIRRTESSDSTLASLTIDHGTLSPVFSPDSLIYDAMVMNSVATLQVTPIASNGKAVVHLNDSPLAFPDVGVSVPLAIGSNQIRIRINAEDGVHYSIYTLRINRRPPDPDLATLVTNAGAFTPVFSKSVTSYQMKVSNGTSSIRITSTCSDKTAVLKVNGATTASGMASGAIPLKAGMNSISVSVGDSAGFAIKTYTIQITRAYPPDAVLSGLSVVNAALSPSFKPGTTAYSTKFPNTTNTVKIRAIASTRVASITVNGAHAKSGVASKPVRLKVGRNTIQVKVTGKDGTTKTYKITVTRASARSSIGLAQPFLGASSQSERPVVSRITSSGRSYLRVTAPKRHDGSKPLIEVSSNLVDWLSGDRHTKVLADHENLIDVCDRTPISQETKRYIRLRWLAP